ncbi:sigma-54-dependent transcriptional regulator [Pseudomonas viridiflava]|uniref:sigma-54-dependent transcriptional regulator n=3 Tax=Pseudomonas viridiflava TaxID=33069 RepID=UPI000F07DF21|nr:sigma-54 dependent transcriptional regulator [Pseudomonas viridiflava]
MEAATENQGRILLVDDESAILRTFRYCLEDEGYSVATANSAAQADTLMQRQVFDLCFLDLRLGEDNGLDVLAQMRVQAPWMRVVIVTAHSAVDTAVDAIQAGAADYLVKPCSPDQLRLATAKQLEVRQLSARLEALEGEIRKPKDGLDSHSPSMMAILETARQVAVTDANILILGESGTGKGELARAIHGWSKRAKKSCVTINCPSLTAELMESELFGHEKGAFTGAITSRAGRFELANGGTLFLDEIGDMPLPMQVKLLRVLQERTFERVGSNKTQSIDVRIIAATHKNLENMIEIGSFREDLYYRLNVFPIEMAPLRERVEDIPLLMNELISRMEHEKRGSIRFNSAAIMSLCRHAWPGNVRELANLVERMAIMHPYGVIGVAELPKKFRYVDDEDEQMVDSLRSEIEERVAINGHTPNFASGALLPPEGLDLKDYLGGLEQGLIQQALDDANGIVARAAERLRIRRTTLVEKMRKYGMSRREGDEQAED